METHPIVDRRHGHRAFAFEIETAYVQDGTIAAILKGVTGVSHVRERHPLARPNEIHVEFRYMAREYVVWEPFGEHRRYWIGPRNTAAAVGTIELIEAAFRDYQPPLHRQLIGDLLSLRLVKHLVGS